MITTYYYDVYVIHASYITHYCANLKSYLADYIALNLHILFN